MAKYPKSRRRSERKGWRPASVSSLPPGIGLADVEKAGKRLLEMLANSDVEGSQVLLNQAYLLCQRIVAFRVHDQATMNQLDIQLRHNGDLLYRLGLGKNGIHQNLWISRIAVNKEGGLKDLCRQLEKKLRPEGKMIEAKK